MFEFVKDLFIKAGSGPLENPAQKNTDDVKIATCALFLEMAQIDDQFSSEEQKTILSIKTPARYIIRSSSPSFFSRRLADTGKGVFSSWAKSDTLNSSTIQKNSSRALRFSAVALGERSLMFL